MSEEYPTGTPWWFIIADRRAHTLGNWLYVSIGSLLTIAPMLYEMLPEFKEALSPVMFHFLTSILGVLMLGAKAWASFQNAKKMKESL